MSALSGSERALLTARFGLMRFGAFRFGFAPKNVKAAGFYIWTRVYPRTTTNYSWTRVFGALLLACLFGCAHTAKVTPTATVKPKQPQLELRASRQMAFAGQPILLTAALVGGEDVESLYCPDIVWTWPDGTESRHEADCPPFEQREEYPRRWTRWVALAYAGQVYPVGFRIEKAGRVLRRALPLTLQALGGE